MASKWGIPLEVEKEVLKRDIKCVYCGIHFGENQDERKNRPSWEHIVNDIRINGTDNIALCCISCNASKGAKKLEDWLESNYCNKKNINKNSVAKVVKLALENEPQIKD